MGVIYQPLQIPADASIVIKTYYQPAFTAPIHFHSAYEIIYIASSYGKLYGGSGVTNFKAGDIYVFGPGFGHCFYNDPAFTKTGAMAHAIVIQFTEDFAGNDFFELPEFKKIRTLLNKASFGLRLNVKQSTRDRFSAFSNKPMPNFILLLQLLQELSETNRKHVHQLGNDLTSFTGIDDFERIESVVKYILENFRTNVKSSVAASLACLNEAAFCRYFKRRTGKTFSQFVNSVRIEHACSMLQDSDESISDICFECGYQNVSYFNRQFKSAKGIRPLEYRNVFSKGH